MNTPIAIVVGAAIVGLGLYISVPRYEFHAISNSANAAIWKVDRFSGDVYLCATSPSKDNESACSAKMKQF